MRFGFFQIVYPPHKKSDESISVTQRLEMLNRAIKGNPKFIIEGIELEREGPSYTYDTIKLLTQKERKHGLFIYHWRGHDRVSSEMASNR